LFEAFLERGALLGIRQQSPKCCECAPGIAVADDIYAFEQGMQDLAAIPTLLVNEPFPQIAVQILEPLAHATEIASEFIGELDDIPGCRDLSIQPIALNHQLGNATLRVNVRSLGEPDQLIDDDREPAFSGGRARLQQRRHVAYRIGRCGGQFVFFLG
jgi:hypothetical protein